jgi:holliday junction DNA helicase RuvB
MNWDDDASARAEQNMQAVNDDGAPASQRGAVPPGLRSDSDEGPPPQAATQARRRLKSAPEASGETEDSLARAEQAELAARRAHLDRDDGGSGMVSALADADEREIEGALRPKRLAEFTGQARVREQLSLILQSALRRGRPPDHVLLAGPPGLGKTTIAMIVAAELGAPLRITSGPAIERSGDLAAVLSTLSEGEVVFIDEIHRLARPAEEMLYLAMEDFRVDVVIGKGPGATAIPLEIAPFTLVGATTRAGLLPAPLRDRFGFTAHLDFYAPDELEQIIRRSAGLLGVALTDEGAAELSTRSRGTPRIANRLLRRVRDYAEVRADGVVTRDIARTALEIYEVDEYGLDRLDRGVLEAVVRRFGGGPVGLSTLAVALGEEAETVEVVAEPFLVRRGLLARTPRGRVATAAGWTHLGLTPPPSLAELPTLFD